MVPTGPKIISAAAMSEQKPIPYIFLTRIRMVATAIDNPETPTRLMAMVFLVVILMVAREKMASATNSIYSDIVNRSILTSHSLICLHLNTSYIYLMKKI